MCNKIAQMNKIPIYWNSLDLYLGKVVHSEDFANRGGI